MEINSTGELISHSWDWNEEIRENIKDNPFTVMIVTNVSKSNFYGYYKCSSSSQIIKSYTTKADIFIGKWPEGSLVGVYHLTLVPKESEIFSVCPVEYYRDVIQELGQLY